MIKIGSTVTFLDEEKLTNFFTRFRKRYFAPNAEYEKRILKLAGKEFIVMEMSNQSKPTFYIHINDGQNDPFGGTSLTGVWEEMFVPEVVIKLDKVLE